MAQSVDAFTFVDLSFLFGQVVDSLGVVNRKRTALGIGKKPGLRAMLFPIRDFQVKSLLLMFVVNVREPLTRLPHLAAQYMSTSDWDDYAFTVVGLAYHVNTLLLSSMLFLTFAGIAFSALRRS